MSSGQLQVGLSRSLAAKVHVVRQLTWGFVYNFTNYTFRKRNPWISNKNLSVTPLASVSFFRNQVFSEIIVGELIVKLHTHNSSSGKTIAALRNPVLAQVRLPVYQPYIYIYIYI